MSHWQEEATIHKVDSGRVKREGLMERLMPALAPNYHPSPALEATLVCICSKEDNTCTKLLPF